MTQPKPATPNPAPRMLFCGICKAWETPEHRCSHITEILASLPWYAKQGASA